LTCSFGLGRVLLSGVHFEFDASKMIHLEDSLREKLAFNSGSKEIIQFLFEKSFNIK
jgi:hypothetical protein